MKIRNGLLGTVMLAATLACGTVVPALADSMVRMALNADIRGTNPGVTRDGNTDIIHGHIIEGLVTYGANFEIIPMLAESYEVSDDGLTYTFHLRKGVKFHNGAVMTSKEVLWSWNRLAGPESESHCKNYFNGKNNINVVAAETPDENTFVIRLERPYAVFLATIARFDCGAMGILHPDSVNPDGSWNAPIGTGPYMLGDHLPGRYVELKRFPDYVSRDEPLNGYGGGKHAEVDTLHFDIVGEGAVAKTALQAGDLDLVQIDAMAAAELQGQPGFTVDATQSAVWDTYLLNPNDPLLKDVRIRQAMAHAIDPEQIMAAITEGFGKASPSPVPPMSANFTQVEAQYPAYDVELARSLMQQAGYDGEEITILATRRNGAYYERALMAQAMLMDAGFNAKLEVVEWGTQLEAYRKAEGYTMQSFSFSPRLQAGLSFEMFTGAATRKAWQDPEAIALVNESLQTGDPARLQRIIDELSRRFNTEVPAIGLGHRMLFTGLSDRVEGFENWGAGMLRGWMLRVAG
ncbi:ABC transporter substrate-binding protein [Pseudodonghicola flavimaris]|uniref:ABC transporter substrate-binding protein n=1 Tax=Pseudodonghicola flavimaris TaxID=3050036 RepID=A0ABT7F827_9RHOB|nr:ABC transporter substrate-binding protein [Pseudodonghicola flavimaris]MDK3020779.1 ABC transporter substrate-binding protein [Pseudodonghicola flavimaris]